MSESVMISLVEKGMDRQEAHEIIRKLVIQSSIEKEDFERLLISDETIRRYLDEEEIRNALNPKKYIGTAIEKTELVIERLRSSY